MLETYPQLIGYDKDVFNYFKEQCVQSISFFCCTSNDLQQYRSHLCGYDINLTYPETKPIPPVTVIAPTIRNVPWFMSASRFRKFYAKLQRRTEAIPATHSKRYFRESKQLGKRNLAGRANGTLDPWVDLVSFPKFDNTNICIQYGCLLLNEFIDYAINFTYPWCKYMHSACRILAYTLSAAAGFTNDGQFDVCASVQSSQLVTNRT